MTEETVMVTCSLTGEQVEEKTAVKYTLPSGEERAVSTNAVMDVVNNAMLGTVLRQVALNNDMYREVVAIRRAAEAQQAGVTEGANKAVEAIRKSAQDLGYNQDIEAIIQKAFAPPPEKVPDDTTTDATGTTH